MADVFITFIVGRHAQVLVLRYSLLTRRTSVANLSLRCQQFMSFKNCFAVPTCLGHTTVVLATAGPLGERHLLWSATFAMYRLLSLPC